jgi:hypothetical protein
LIRQWQGFQVLHEVANIVRRSGLHVLPGTLVCRLWLPQPKGHPGAWCTLSWPATEAAALASAEYTAYLLSWGWRPKGPARVRRAWKSCTVGSGASCKKLSSAYAKGLARFIAATCSSGPCKVSAKSSGPRISPCSTPFREWMTTRSAWWKSK